MKQHKLVSFLLAGLLLGASCLMGTSVLSAAANDVTDDSGISPLAESQDVTRPTCAYTKQYNCAVGYTWATNLASSTLELYTSYQYAVYRQNAYTPGMTRSVCVMATTSGGLTIPYYRYARTYRVDWSPIVDFQATRISVSPKYTPDVSVTLTSLPTTYSENYCWSFTYEENDYVYASLVYNDYAVDFEPVKSDTSVTPVSATIGDLTVVMRVSNGQIDIMSNGTTLATPVSFAFAIAEEKP